MVVDLEEEEDGLEYEMEEEPSDPSYTTPPSTGGCSFPSTCCPSHSPTPEALDLENNVHLQMELIEAWVEAFLAEAESTVKETHLRLRKGEKLIAVRSGLCQ